jgi:hypothetical protein
MLLQVVCFFGTFGQKTKKKKKEESQPVNDSTQNERRERKREKLKSSREKVLIKRKARTIDNR